MIDLYCVSETGEKMQIRGEHFPIGGGGLYQKTTIETQMVENPFKGTFYLFSDGFQDQFGGSKGKKYGKNKLLEFLSSIEHLSAEEQSNRIKIELIDWMKNRDQVDDISILGFKVGNL
jgi:serine phosphatase RsbU (regulator of sigma subunit)